MSDVAAAQCTLQWVPAVTMLLEVVLPVARDAAVVSSLVAMGLHDIMSLFALVQSVTAVQGSSVRAKATTLMTGQWHFGKLY